MSDDERMDRAERIRQMREGNKAETTDDTEETDNAPADGAGEQPDDGGETADTAPAESAAAAGDDTADEAAVADRQATDDGGSDTDSNGVATAQSDTDAMAAAQRAAEASAQMTTETGDAGVADQSTDDLSASASPMQGPTGVELPDQELIEEAMATDNTATTEGGARAAAVDDESAGTEEMVRVLEFALGDEYYCLDIDYVEEIVKRETVTRVPNTEDYVEGVVDLRGQITTILNPKAMMDIDSDGTENLIVVFDAGVFEEQGAMGWIVDEVRQVVPVAESEVNTAPVDGEYINGVVDQDDQEEFVIWIEPDDVLGNATADGED